MRRAFSPVILRGYFILLKNSWNQLIAPAFFAVKVFQLAGIPTDVRRRPKMLDIHCAMAPDFLAEGNEPVVAFDRKSGAAITPMAIRTVSGRAVSSELMYSPAKVRQKRRETISRPGTSSSCAIRLEEHLRSVRS